jgi:hypothetical protein
MPMTEPAVNRPIAEPPVRQPEPVASEPEAVKSEFWQREPRTTQTRKPSGLQQKPAAGKKPGSGRPAQPGLDSYDTRKPVVRKPRPIQGPPKRRPGKKSQRPRHLDWAWELIGFVICVVIAMIVFFSVPSILSP